jgi:hemerythrin-like domain-containing protein
MDSALDMLRAEHERMLRGTEVALAVADRLEQGERLPTGTLSALANFFSYVVHRNHRDKEDGVLFPRLSDKGFYEGQGCVGVLLNEHSESAQSFGRMLEAAEAYEHGDRNAAATWTLATRQYVDELRRHIRREEDVLVPNAERQLSAADHQELIAEFKRIEERAQFAGMDEVLEDFERIAQTLGQSRVPRGS